MQSFSVSMGLYESVRLREVQPPVIPIVAEWIRAHPGTISLGQGVVYYGPPPQAEHKIVEFLADPQNHRYQPVDGIAPLRERLAAKLRRDNGVDVGASRRIVVTAGGNMAFMNAILAVADPGDEVILQSPYYFNHEMAIRIAGCRPVVVPTDERHQLRVDAIRAAITPRTRAVVTVSPNNPTGAVYPERSLRELNAVCGSAGVYHVHDEAYEYFTYGRAAHFSPASIAGAVAHTICLHSLSKSYGFASWRIGSMLIPDHLYDAVRKIQDTILICPPVVSQFAAVGALEVGRAYCDHHRPAIEKVRHVFLEQMTALRGVCDVPPADGAFYFFVTLHTRMPAMALVERLIREHGVAVMPGTTFGVEDRCAVRVSYGALQPETAIEGVGRLVRGLRAIAKS
jgi:aspartate/methionine/tyrosine aminotransferase